jgi:hypothetical protein
MTFSSFRLAYCTITIRTGKANNAPLYEATVTDVTGSMLGRATSIDEAAAVGEAVLAARQPFADLYEQPGLQGD